MLKRIFCLSLCVLLVLPFAGCKKKDYTLSVDNESVVVSPEPKPVVYINPLTGENNMDKDSVLLRPVAIMVNNISVAQPVQTGLNKADIIYETEVEGGITRLLAVYKNLKSVEQIGTVRSARYDYVDLAAGHNAIYVHHGQDDYHAKPHFYVVDRIVLGTNNGGARVKNGLASEHTLYAYGDKLWESMVAQNLGTTLEKEETPWQTFADEKTPVKFETASSGVTVPFSSSYKTTFKYNAETGKYARYFGNTERKDYKTGEPVTVKNVFVLSTSIGPYPGCNDGKHHVKVQLQGGSGYYFVNGTYKKINWTKGNSSDPIKFTNEDGTPLIVNPGNSWVCIADSNDSQPIIAE